jgi:hypothetical protein
MWFLRDGEVEIEEGALLLAHILCPYPAEDISTFGAI